MKFLSKYKKKQDASTTNTLGKDGKKLADFVYKIFKHVVKGETLSIISYLAIKGRSMEKILQKNGYDTSFLEEASVEELFQHWKSAQNMSLEEISKMLDGDGAGNDS